MPSKELVVSQTRHETKVGVLEDGQLVEVHFQRANEYSLAGSIHKGRVTRVLPGMQSAFVDLGLERDTFLYVSDFFDEHGDEVEKVEEPVPGGNGRGRGRSRGRGRDRERGREVREGGTTPPASEAITEAAPEPSVTLTRPSVEDAGENRGDRRSRRPRRRRGGDRGLPDSKYASPGDTLESGEPEEAEAEEATAGERPGEVILLPGESLAKYRKATPSWSSAPEAPMETPEAEDSALEEAAEEAEAAALEEAADEAVEQLLDRVDELEQEEILARSGEPTITVESDVTGEFEAAGEDEEEEDDDAAAAWEDDEIEEAAGPLVAGDDAAEEALAETGVEIAAVAGPEAAEAAGEESGLGGEDQPAGESAELGEPEEGIAQASEDEGGVEPARMPQSLTATLRAKGERVGHRVSRRSRRRGRGGSSEAAEMAPATAVPAAPEVVAVAQAEPQAPRRAEPPPERERRERPPLPSISELLKEGQEIIVQIAKEPLGQKGARITSHIALPGRYVVYMPTVEHYGVSRKISTEEERMRLKRILQKYQEGVPGGYIMRTAGEGRSEEDIAADMRYLANLWQDIRSKAEKRRAPALLHHDVQIVERLLRDQLTEGFKAVWVDSEDLYEQVLHSMERLAPALLNRVKLYTRPEPIFDAFGITQELEKALRPKVWLKSGGYIVINQTEALVAIDINTGKYVGKSNRLEDTIVKTNLEAVKEIVRQMRLRDLGGIIVVDFIDMDERKNRQKVMQALEEAMRADKAPYKILQFNDFGLVAITRKRVKQSLERALCSPCPYCEGAGYVKSVETVVGEILAEAQKYAKVVDGKDCLLRVNPEVAKVLKSIDNKYLEELEETLGRPVLVTADASLHQEKFDLT